MGIFHFDWRRKFNGNVVPAILRWIIMIDNSVFQTPIVSLMADWVAMFNAILAHLHIHISIFGISFVKGPQYQDDIFQTASNVMSRPRTWCTRSHFLMTEHGILQPNG